MFCCNWMMIPEKDFDIEVKPMLRSIHHAVTFLKGSLNQNDIINSARHSVISYPLHESHLYLIKFFQFCSDTGNPELHHPIIQLLKIKNSHLKTQIYLCLHSLVQNIMGISHALNKFDPCKKIYFLLSSHKVIEQVCKTIMNEDSSSSLKIACEEILLYLLKSEHILKKIWHQIVTTVLVPNIVYLECLSNPDTRLGKMILNALNPDSDLRTFSGLNKNQLLESNFRLLFHNSLNLRQAVQANIKVFVAQEENSCLKLPRFADIFESDISDSFIKRTKDILNFRNIVESNQKSIGEFIKVMETLFLSDDTCSLEIERSLSHLIVLLEDNLIHIKFIESGGFKKIVEIWENILKEDNLEYGGELLPIVLKVMKVLLVKK
ncbi:unnamed protein product [Lepeophtheirus salmonis]|uniref:(salmon louse) hypothetical protein n=1 Tax=Lepeophtheirus salmonis TaxID=72036 RepID=A0A7R8H2E2_LEPSM|nr:unnamed protein product [Lepeophtheirus salmonis]CAF2812373.1 unnamed protein product [Lepeophtheirus salmonis]